MFATRASVRNTSRSYVFSLEGRNIIARLSVTANRKAGPEKIEALAQAFLGGIKLSDGSAAPAAEAPAAEAPAAETAEAAEAPAAETEEAPAAEAEEAPAAEAPAAE